MNGKLLPETWLAKLAIDCFDQISTTNSKVKSKDCLPEGLYPVIDQGQTYISGYINDESKVIKVDSPICIFGDHTRIVKWVVHDFVPGADGTKLLQPKAFIHPRYAYYSLCALNIPDKGYSRHFKYFKELEINLPGRLEQNIIAEKLDTLLAQVDSTKARLEQIPQILKRFRQAVLVSAVNGKLQAESSNKECCTIDSLCLTSFDGPFGSKLKTSDYTNSGIRVVRLENIGHLEFNSEKETYISHEKYKSLYSNTLKENDLIFSSFVDEDVRVCLMPQSEQTFINKADCFCLRVNPSLASPHYLALVLASKTSYEQIKEKVQGITRPRINLRTLRSLKFDIPDLKDQLEIVRRVEQLFAYADTIEKQVNSALTRVNNLTQSILAKAFRGELTAQWRAENPDLISGENSAAALLEKIKTERTASGGKKTSRKKN
ncbi:TPA: specificity determinant for hsdM and hsdR [Raoultella ornithinolytica]|nr:specificity determinant for hsdM and hsdR [Raoultella ornithinolytica]